MSKLNSVIKRIYLKVGRSLGYIDRGQNKELQEPQLTTRNDVLYKIGTVNMHSSFVDNLIPQAVTIGENFISSLNSMIIAHDASLFNHIGKHRVEEVIIGDNVFLGAGAIILPGVTVGDGAIIGAGAIVTKDVQSYSVVAGNPARFICTVQEYIEKCKAKNVIFDTPESFSSYYTNSLTVKEVKEFQEKYIHDKENGLR